MALDEFRVAGTDNALIYDPGAANVRKHTVSEVWLPPGEPFYFPLKANYDLWHSW